MHPKKMKEGKKKELLIFLYKATIKPKNKLSLPLPEHTILQISTLPNTLLHKTLISSLEFTS